MEKVCLGLPEELRRKALALAQKVEGPARGGSDSGRSAVFAAVVQAVARQVQVRLEVDDPDDPECRVTKVSPTALKLDGAGPVLVGRSSHHRRTASFRIATILRASILEEPAAPATGPASVRSRPLGEARLRVSARVAQDLRDAPWHPLQRLEDSGDSAYLLTVPLTDERAMIGRVLALAGEAEVLGPATLREAVRRIAVGIARGHQAADRAEPARPPQNVGVATVPR